MNNYNKNKNTQNLNTQNQAATIAVIAGLITTLGDGLSTIAAALALQEAQQQCNQNSGNNDYTAELFKMQKRIEALEKEIKEMKKRL
ncbi:hypothetical protein MTP04_26150 [Lysinibacillus sp. PLM2]|nr:hypothetical protein MTP04_26150 [Lysinibacillus sp. PLM2]